MRGRTCIVTGGTSGIGRATALALGRLGANLVVLGRNERAGARVVGKLRQINGGGTAEYLRVDLADQESVRRTAATINARFATIDLLVNNAGARYDVYRESPERIELTFAGNHLGHFLFTALLLDRLLAAATASIVTVTSGSHRGAPMDGVWLMPADTYDRRQAYARSKLANLVFAFSLAERLKQTRVASLAYDPGGVASHFSHNNGLISWGRHLLSHAVRRELVPPRVAAAGIVHLACNPGLAGANGRYFRRQTEVAVSPRCRDAKLAHALWELSIRLTGLDEKIGEPAWRIFRL